MGVHWSNQLVHSLNVSNAGVESSKHEQRARNALLMRTLRKMNKTELRLQMEKRARTCCLEGPFWVNTSGVWHGTAKKCMDDHVLFVSLSISSISSLFLKYSLYFEASSPAEAPKGSSPSLSARESGSTMNSAQNSAY